MVPKFNRKVEEATDNPIGSFIKQKIWLTVKDHYWHSTDVETYDKTYDATI